MNKLPKELFDKEGIMLKSDEDYFYYVSPKNEEDDAIIYWINKERYVTQMEEGIWDKLDKAEVVDDNTK